MRSLTQIYVRPTSPRAATATLLAVACVLVFGLPEARAQEVAQPNQGRQHFTAGLSLNPGLMIDPGAATGDRSFATAGMAQLGLTHIITRHFFMSAEAEAGVQWMREHSAAKVIPAPNSKNFAWQVGIYGHWLPFGQQSGWVANAGVHLFTAHLEDAPLQVLAGEVRLGRYIWSDDERFLLLQVGYALPILQGLSRPTEYEDNADWADENWSFHRMSLGFQYGF